MLHLTDIYWFFVDSRIVDMETARSSETPVNSYQLHCQYPSATAVRASNLTHMVPYVLPRSRQGIEPHKNFRPLTTPRDSSTCSKKPDIFPIILHAFFTQSSLCEWRSNVKWKVSTMHENYVQISAVICYFTSLKVRGFFSTSCSDTLFTVFFRIVQENSSNSTVFI